MHAIMDFGREKSVRKLCLTVVIAEVTFGLIQHPWKQIYIFGYFIYCQNLGNNRKFIPSLYILAIHNDKKIYQMMLTSLSLWCHELIAPIENL